MSPELLQFSLDIMTKVMSTTGMFITILLPTVGLLGGIHLLIDFLFSVTFRKIR